MLALMPNLNTIFHIWQFPLSTENVSVNHSGSVKVTTICILHVQLVKLNPFDVDIIPAACIPAGVMNLIVHIWHTQAMNDLHYNIITIIIVRAKLKIIAK